MPSQDNKKNHKKGVLRSVLFFFCVFILCIIIFFVSRIESLQMQDIETIEGNSIVSDTDIRLAFKEYSNKKTFLPVTNTFIFSRKKFSQELQDTFPRLKTIDVAKKNNKLSLFVSERTASYLWCGERLTNIDETAPCFLVDEKGFIFDEAPFFSGSSFLRLYGGIDVNTDSMIGQYVDSNILEYHDVLVDVLQSFGIFMQAIVFIDNNHQLHLILDSHHPLTDSPYIAIHSLNGILESINIIEIALTDSVVLSDIKKNYDKLEYIDLRFSNQFIYKFKNENTLDEKSSNFIDLLTDSLDVDVEENYEQDNESN